MHIIIAIYQICAIPFIGMYYMKVKVTQSCLTLCNPMDCPWNSPGQKSGVGNLSLLQGIFPTQGLNPHLPHCRWILYQLSHQGSPRTLEWVAYLFSRESSWPRNQTGVSCIAGRFFPNWAIREAIYALSISVYMYYISLYKVAQWWWIHLQCRRPGFDPWVGKIPWRRAWQPTPVFLPGESHGQRSLEGYSP